MKNANDAAVLFLFYSLHPEILVEEMDKNECI